MMLGFEGLLRRGLEISQFYLPAMIWIPGTIT